MNIIYQRLGMQNMTQNPVEFDSDGRFTYFRDYTKGVVEFEHQFNGAQQVFYEYMKPSLYTYLKDRGVNFDFETTDFKLTDSTV